MTDDSAIDAHLKSWDDVFTQRAWGRYPPEELIRFIGRNFGRVANKTAIRALEVGCGPGANLWFLAREGYSIAGIDGSPTAIEQAKARLAADLATPDKGPDLRIGNFAELPWSDASFDIAIDIEAISMNGIAVIRQTIAEIYRVLRPGGFFFAKMFSTNTTGYRPDIEIEPGTVCDPMDGPCVGYDIAHYFTKDELKSELSMFSRLGLDWVRRSDHEDKWIIEEWLVTARK